MKPHTHRSLFRSPPSKADLRQAVGRDAGIRLAIRALCAVLCAALLVLQLAVSWHAVEHVLHAHPVDSGECALCLANAANSNLHHSAGLAGPVGRRVALSVPRAPIESAAPVWYRSRAPPRCV